jgi:hypothetical protein
LSILASGRPSISERVPTTQSVALPRRWTIVTGGKRRLDTDQGLLRWSHGFQWPGNVVVRPSFNCMSHNDSHEGPMPCEQGLPSKRLDQRMFLIGVSKANNNSGSIAFMLRGWKRLATALHTFKRLNAVKRRILGIELADDKHSQDRSVRI